MSLDPRKGKEAQRKQFFFEKKNQKTFARVQTHNIHQTTAATSWIDAAKTTASLS